MNQARLFSGFVLSAAWPWAWSGGWRRVFLAASPGAINS